MRRHQQPRKRERLDQAPFKPAIFLARGIAPPVCREIEPSSNYLYRGICDFSPAPKKEVGDVHLLEESTSRDSASDRIHYPGHSCRAFRLYHPVRRAPELPRRGRGRDPQLLATYDRRDARPQPQCLSNDETQGHLHALGDGQDKGQVCILRRHARRYPDRPRCDSRAHVAVGPWNLDLQLRLRGWGLPDRIQAHQRRDSEPKLDSD